MSLTLHGYWRSGAAWRVRIPLALKGVAYAQVTHDLRTSAQKDPGFLTLNPQGLVPALDIGEAVLIQSLTILEWLDERYPEPVAQRAYGTSTGACDGRCYRLRHPSAQ